MATRIFVHCRSHEMPGPHGEKNRRMANAACQKSWGRDFSAGAGDRLITFGGYFLYNQRCWLIVDNGPVDSTQYEIKAFKWSKAKQDLEPIQGPLHAYILKEFEETYQFDPAKRPKLRYSDEEFVEKFGTERLEQIKQSIQEKRDIAKRFNPPTEV